MPQHTIAFDSVRTVRKEVSEISVDLLGTGARISRPQKPIFDHLGPRVEVITHASSPLEAPGLLRGMIGPGQAVPMHSHSSPETFYVLTGVVEGLTFSSDGVARWTEVGVGEAFFVPPNARHALRNNHTEPATTLIITNAELVQFFETTGRPVESFDQELAPPPPKYVQEFIYQALQRGHWLASPQENAAVGIELLPPPPTS